MLGIGQVFGRLTLIQPTEKRKSHSIVWLCGCSCGARVEVSGTNLRSGYTHSCGCLKRELLRRRASEAALHGHMRGNKPSPTYQTWKNIIQRCGNPKHTAYPHYGGAGIRVAEVWRNSFPQFLLDMGERPEGLTLDRIDSTKGYEPGNCRWVTLLAQAQNKSNNVFVTWNGETLVVAEWARRLGMTPSSLARRLKTGWTVEAALTTPPRILNHTPARSPLSKAERLERSRFKQRYRHLEGDLTYDQWKAILEKHDHRCVYCSTDQNITMDHVEPLSKGGPHTASNVVPACRSCNSSKRVGSKPRVV